MTYVGGFVDVDTDYELVVYEHKGSEAREISNPFVSEPINITVKAQVIDPVDPNQNNDLNIGLIIGCAIGAVALIGTIIAGAIIYNKKKDPAKASENKIEDKKWLIY